MTERERAKVRSLEGRQVSLALADGSRMDDCQLVSGGRTDTKSIWVFTDGVDTFIPLGEVLAVWEILQPNERSVR